ncbi:hypothetical protein BT69DRAFT_1321133 [Atractiella rhizophila]|nr:hypothetical protein BT69DRAFT_1321133 [Atractiella rhizophila]
MKQGAVRHRIKTVNADELHEAVQFLKPSNNDNGIGLRTSETRWSGILNCTIAFAKLVAVLRSQSNDLCSVNVSNAALQKLVLIVTRSQEALDAIALSGPQSFLPLQQFGASLKPEAPTNDEECLARLNLGDSVHVTGKLPSNDPFGNKSSGIILNLIEDPQVLPIHCPFCQSGKSQSNSAEYFVLFNWSGVTAANTDATRNRRAEKFLLRSKIFEVRLKFLDFFLENEGLL